MNTEDSYDGYVESLKNDNTEGKSDSLANEKHKINLYARRKIEDYFEQKRFQNEFGYFDEH